MTAATLCDGVGRDVTANWQDRVPCPVCGQRIRVTKANTIGSHPAKEKP